MVRGLIFAIALLATEEVRAEPSSYLKGFTDVMYKGVVEYKTEHCDIDMKAWYTSIDFVANQSTKLRLWKEADHAAQVKARSDKLSKLSGVDPSDAKAWLQGGDWEALEKFSAAPVLSFVLSSIEMPSGCAGAIDIAVWALLKDSKMLGTGTLVPAPSILIWGSNNLIRASFQTFSSYAIQTSEQIMKEFVNDWAASQRLP